MYFVCDSGIDFRFAKRYCYAHSLFEEMCFLLIDTVGIELTERKGQYDIYEIHQFRGYFSFSLVSVG